MPDEPNQDPILADVRRNRDALVRASGGSIESLFALLKERQSQDAPRLVKYPARRPGSNDPGPSATDAA